MSLDTLIAGIQAEAREEADRIVAAARSKADLIVKEEEQVTREAAQREQQLEVDRCRKEAGQRVSQARLAARSRLLRVEQELVEEVLELVLEKLHEMEGTTYRSWMKQRLLEAVESEEDRVVVCRRDRERLTLSWVEDMERALQERTPPIPLQLEFEDADFGGGFIIRHPRYEVDATFRQVLRSLDEQRRGDIARLLFEDSG